MELKYVLKLNWSTIAESSNRTFMELKCRCSYLVMRSYRRSNRTFMELKSKFSQAFRAGFNCSNRTFMELKYKVEIKKSFHN